MKTKNFRSLKYLVIFLMAYAPIIRTYCQNRDKTYDESDYGLLITDRNSPILETKVDSTIVPCRKLISKPVIFCTPYQIKDIAAFENKAYSNLTGYEKSLIIDKTWQTKDTSLLKIIYRIALEDSSEEDYDNRICSIRCLSQFKSDSTKKVLLHLLKDKACGMTSALSLVQLNLANLSFKYIEQHYNEVDNKSEINTAMMVINSPEAIEVLKKISEDKDPSNALDALAALSLLGYCDYAFNGFVKYSKSDIWQVREKAAWCLAYYTGTNEAFNIIKGLENDEYYLDVKKIESIYNIKK